MMWLIVYIAIDRCSFNHYIVHMIMFQNMEMYSVTAQNNCMVLNIIDLEYTIQERKRREGMQQ